MFRYRVHRKKDGRIVYSTTIVTRIFALAFAIVLALGFASYLAEGLLSASAIVPVIFAILFLLVAFYRDEWIFDNTGRTATSITGLGPVVKRTVHSYDEIECIAVRHFYKGIAEGSASIRPSWRHKEMSSLRLNFDDEGADYVNIEIGTAKREGLRIEELAKTLARLTGLALDIDRSVLETGLRSRLR